MKIISKANNLNNSRATIEFSENGILSAAAAIAEEFGCGFNHNVTSRPVEKDDEIAFPISFGTISFNKGNHKSALEKFAQ